CLPSFPTRRSSDLSAISPGRRLRGAARGSGYLSGRQANSGRGARSGRPLDHPQHVNDAETQVVDRPVAEMREERSERTLGRRVQLAQVLAFVAVLAGFVGALGPAQPIRTTYSWPPRTLPRGNPSRLWYAPLLLAHRIPESLSARLPCRLP